MIRLFTVVVLCNVHVLLTHVRVVVGEGAHQSIFVKMKLFQLFLAASIPVIKVILVTLVGSFIALDRINILPEEARKYINHIVFYVFNPALIFAYLTKTLTVKSLVELWFMPLNLFITFVVGSILGWIVIHLTKAPAHLRGLILGCCAAGNLGNMPLIIIPAVCKEKSSPFGDPDVCLKYGMAYVSLSLAIGSFYMWSYVYNIVRISSKRAIKQAEANGSRNGATNEVLNTTQENSIELPVPPKDNSLSDDDDRENGFALPYSITNEKVEMTNSVNLKDRLQTLARKMNLKRILAPSTIGAMVGFVVGVVGPFRRLLIGESAPLHVIQDVAALLGDGAIPSISLIMGGNLTKGLKGSGVHFSIIIGIVIVRYVLSPLSGILVFKGALHFGMIHTNPLYNFVLLLQFAVPPAMNISTMTQLFGAGESECSVIMLWAYALASVSLTLWSILFMWMVS